MDTVSLDVQQVTPYCRLQALGVGEDDPLEHGPDEEAVDEPPVSCEPPPAYPALQARRDSVRGWLCALYAFAAPNRRGRLVSAVCVVHKPVWGSQDSGLRRAQGTLPISSSSQ